jgi:hypothetical protein
LGSDSTEAGYPLKPPLPSSKVLALSVVPSNVR